MLGRLSCLGGSLGGGERLGGTTLRLDVCLGLAATAMRAQGRVNEGNLYLQRLRA